MPKFKFPLQKVLQHRKTLEDIAQTDFQAAMAALHNEMDKLAKMDNEVVLARERAFKTQSQGGKASPGLIQVDEFLKGQSLRRERQMEKIKECEGLVENLREILRQKAIDYKIIEELKDRKKTEFKVRQQKLEQKQTDDMNIMRFEREEK